MLFINWRGTISSWVWENPTSLKHLTLGECGWHKWKEAPYSSSCQDPNSLSHSLPSSAGMPGLMNLVLGGTPGSTGLGAWLRDAASTGWQRGHKRNVTILNPNILGELSYGCHGRTPSIKWLSGNTPPSVKDMIYFYRTPWKNFHGLH